MPQSDQFHVKNILDKLYEDTYKQSRPKDAQVVLHKTKFKKKIKDLVCELTGEDPDPRTYDKYIMLTGNEVAELSGKQQDICYRLAAIYYYNKATNKQEVIDQHKATSDFYWQQFTYTANTTHPTPAANKPATLSNKYPQYFKLIKKAKDLVPEDFLERSRNYKKFYHQRPSLDQKVFETLLAGQSVLIMGNPLAGKTRAAYEALTQPAFHEHLIVVPQMPESFNKFPRFESIPEFNGQKIIVFLDDIDWFLQKPGANSLIDNILNNNITIAATCMTGPPYFLFIDEVTYHIRKQFTEIEIQTISKKVIENLIAQKPNVFEKEKNEFDGNIGSLFLDLDGMRGRYLREIQQQKDNSDKHEVAWEILNILKAFYYSSNFENKSTYSVDKIREFYEEKIKLPEKVNQTNQWQADIIKEKIKEGFEKYIRCWDKAIELLRTGHIDLNFIEQQGALNEFIYVEDVYFDKMVVAPDYKIPNINKHIFDIYPDTEERRSKGFYAKAYAYTISMNNTLSYDEALANFQAMKEEGIQPNALTFSTLMKKAPDFDTAWQLLEDMPERVPPNEVTFLTLINKAADFETAQKVEEKMKECKVLPGRSVFIALMQKTSNLAQAREIIQQMEKKQKKPGIIAFNILISKAPDFETAWEILETMKAKSIERDEFTFGILAENALDVRSANKIVEEMKEDKTFPDDLIFPLLIDHLPHFETARQLLIEMKDERSFSSNVHHAFTTLISKAPDFEAAKEVLENMKTNKVHINEYTFNALMSKTNDFEQAKSILDKMDERKIPSDEITFNTLMSKASDFEQAKSILDKMNERKIPPNEITFNILMSKASDFEQAKSILDEMEDKNIPPDEFTFTTLMSKALNFEQAQSILDDMKKNDVLPNEFTFTTLMSKTSDFEQAKSLLDEIEKIPLPLGTSLLNLFLKKSTNFAQTHFALKKMKTHQVMPGKKSFNHLQKKIVANPEEASKIFLDGYVFDPNDLVEHRIITSFFEYFDYAAFINAYKDNIVQKDELIFEYSQALGHTNKAEDRLLAVSLLEYLENKETNAPYHLALGHLYKDVDFDKAFENYQKSLDYSTDDQSKVKPYFSLGLLIYSHQKTKLFNQAIEYCKQAITINPKFYYPKKLLFLLNLYTSAPEDVVENAKASIHHFRFQKEKHYRSIIKDLENPLPGYNVLPVIELLEQAMQKIANASGNGNKS